VTDYLGNFIGSSVSFPTEKWGNLTFESVVLSDCIDGDMVVHIGSAQTAHPPLVRIHSICTFSEVFGSTACDCGDQLIDALRLMTEAGNGLLFYVRMEGRGVGLAAKIAANALETKGMDTFESRLAIGVSPEARDFHPIAAYLIKKNINSVRLLTNNPVKIQALADAGIDVRAEPLLAAPRTETARSLLRTKAERFGHAIPMSLYADAKR
jgi:GTP cyclohydrolase II